jgi:hypothetical protein
VASASKRYGDVRQTVLRPLGLITTPNPYGQFPAGALTDATNCVIRRPGQLQAAPSYTNYTPLTTTGSNDLLRHMCPLNAGHVFSFSNDGSDAWKVSEGIPGGTVNVGAFPAGGVSTTNLFAKARVGSTRSRDRMLVNSNLGVMVGDSMAPASSADRVLRWAGMTQPKMVITGITLAANNPLPVNIMVAYRAILVRELPDDSYRIASVPSVPIKWLNEALSPELVNIQISWGFNVGVVAGDYLEIYRTDGLSTTSVDADPGGTFKLISRVQLTAAMVAASFLSFDDNTPVIAPYYQTSGTELYTNPYQEGFTGANRQPDICQAIATFKGFTFYGNLTERAQVVVHVPGGLGSPLPATGVARLRGIGTRNGAGTVTSGSPTITGISAADLVGIVVGQLLTSPTNGPTVTAVGASTITLSSNALSSAASWSICDRIEVSGDMYAVVTGESLSLRDDFFANQFEVTSNQTIGENFSADFTSVTFVYEPARPCGPNPAIATQSITIRATNGANYSPAFPNITATAQSFAPATRPNLLRWSKDSEPELVPSINETFVGSAAIISMVTTKDALWIACTDGVYRLSGDGGSWRVDLVAPSLVLCSPRCMVNMRETIYAYTNYGFGSITDSGFTPISHTRVRSLLPGPPFAEDQNLILGHNDGEGEVIISPGINAFTHYVWNTFT